MPSHCPFHWSSALAGSRSARAATIHEFRGSRNGRRACGFCGAAAAGIAGKYAHSMGQFFRLIGLSARPGLDWGWIRRAACLPRRRTMRNAWARWRQPCAAAWRGWRSRATCRGWPRSAWRWPPRQGNSIGFLLRQAPAFTPADSTAPAKPLAGDAGAGKRFSTPTARGVAVRQRRPAGGIFL